MDGEAKWAAPIKLSNNDSRLTDVDSASGENDDPCSCHAISLRDGALNSTIQPHGCLINISCRLCVAMEVASSGRGRRRGTQRRYGLGYSGRLTNKRLSIGLRA